MHCEANTLGGAFGFQAVLEDGRVISEFNTLWDEIPRDVPICRLELVDKDGVCLGALADYFQDATTRTFPDRYYFGNEAVSVSSFSAGLADTAGPNLLAGKFIGGVYGNRVLELRLDLLIQPGAVQLLRREFPAQDLRFSAAAFRRGWRPDLRQPALAQKE